MTLDTAQLLAQATPRTVTVPVCARGDLVDAHDKIERQLAGQRQPNSGSLAGSAAPDLTDLARELQDLEAEIEANTVTYTVRSIGKRAWSDLKRQHPPTREEAKRGIDANMDTFPPVAIAACCDPEITVEQSEQLTQVLPEGEWNKLWAAVLGVNLGVLDTPKSAAAAAILRTNGNSGT